MLAIPVNILATSNEITEIAVIVILLKSLH